MLTRLCVAAVGVAVSSLSSHSVHRVHAASAAAPESKSDIKGDTKSDTKGDTKSDTKGVTKAEPKSDTKGDTSAKTKTNKAGDTSSETKKPSVKASELPIYGDPQPVTFEVVEQQPSAYFTAVSDARKFVWTYSDTVQKATSKVCDGYEVAKKTTKDGLQYIQKDSGVVPRAVVISVAGLGGIVAGFRGGFFRKTIYASISMAGAASLCYPDQAAAISKKSWRTVRDFTSQTYKDNVSPGSSSSSKPASTPAVKSKPVQSTNKVDSSATSETKKTEDKKSVTTPSPPSSSPPPSSSKDSGDTVKKDFGMSNKEDKDMYSTRGAK